MRVLRWTAAFVALVLVAGVLFLFFGLDLLRGPLTRAVENATGRELLIEGDIRPSWSLVHPRFRIGRVSLSNAEWAREKYLFAADSVDATISVLPLFYGRVVLPELHLEKPVVNLEQDAGGRKNWILDKQSKPGQPSRIRILRLTLDRGVLTYNDTGRDISVRSDLATDKTGVNFTVTGKHYGLPVATSGHGGPVLALRDDDGAPYPLKAEAKIGSTSATVDGKITRLVGLQGIDMQVRLAGRTMEELYKILGVAFPHTSPYATSGHLVRGDDKVRYENFTGKVGSSDLAGTLEVDTGGKRPFMRGDLNSRMLDLADLGPVVGTQKTKNSGEVLPDAPFDAKRWKSVDADVRLRAGTIQRPEQLPLENLSTRIRMQDAVLTLDPLEFGVAGGRLIGPIRLDGREGSTIKAEANIRVQKLQLSKLFPTMKVTRASVGDLSGAIELKGTGNSVARMLGTANGKVGVYVDGGHVSEFLMEIAAMDLWGVAKTYGKRDAQVAIRCIVGDFGVKDGIMQTNAFVFDTAVVNVGGSGDIDLKNEQLNLTLMPQPKDKSFASLNSPVYVRGSFSAPKPSPDWGKVVTKGAGALVMGILNPLLAVIPLLNEGPGKDSNCAQLIADATAKKGSTASSGQSSSAGGTAPRPRGKSAR